MKKTFKPRREVRLIDVAMLFRTSSGGNAGQTFASVIACTRSLYNTLKGRVSPRELHTALGFGMKDGSDEDDEITEDLAMFEESLVDAELLTEPWWQHGNLPPQFNI